MHADAGRGDNMLLVANPPLVFQLLLSSRYREDFLSLIIANVKVYKT